MENPMSFLTVVLAETGHVALPMPIFVYGVIALVVFAALGFVVWSYRDVANRHQAKAKAYADAHGGARSDH
jgi:heme/copper-type cytochrome/quinol oxidase subunit 2